MRYIRALFVVVAGALPLLASLFATEVEATCPYCGAPCEQGDVLMCRYDGTLQEHKAILYDLRQ